MCAKWPICTTGGHIAVPEASEVRKTGPISQREFVLDDGATLVSTTDLKSRITYCNPAFVAVSGGWQQGHALTPAGRIASWGWA